MAAAQRAAVLSWVVALLVTGAHAYTCTPVEISGQICPGLIEWIHETDESTFTNEFAPTHLNIAYYAYPASHPNEETFNALMLTLDVRICATNGTFSDGTTCVNIRSRAAQGGELLLGVALPPEFTVGITSDTISFYDIYMTGVTGSLSDITGGATAPVYTEVDNVPYTPRTKYGATSKQIYIQFDMPVKHELGVTDLYSAGDLIFTGTFATTAANSGASTFLTALDPPTATGRSQNFLVNITIDGTSPTYTLKGDDRWIYLSDGRDQDMLSLPWPASSQEVDNGAHSSTEVIYATAAGGVNGTTGGYDRCIFVFMDDMNSTLVTDAFVGTGGGIFNTETSTTALFTSAQIGSLPNIVTAAVDTPVVTFGQVACRAPAMQSMRGLYGHYVDAVNSLQSFGTTETLRRPVITSAAYDSERGLLTITVSIVAIDTAADLSGDSGIEILSIGGRTHSLSDGAIGAGGTTVLYQVTPLVDVLGENSPATLIYQVPHNSIGEVSGMQSVEKLGIVGFNGTVITNVNNASSPVPVSAIALDPSCSGGITRVNITYGATLHDIGGPNPGVWTITDGATSRTASAGDITHDGASTIALDFAPSFETGAILTVTYDSGGTASIQSENGEYPAADAINATDGTGPVLLSASAVPGSSVIAAVFDRAVTIASGGDVRFAGAAIFGVAITETNASVVHYATTSSVTIEDIVGNTALEIAGGGVRSGSELFCRATQRTNISGDPTLVAQGAPEPVSAFTRDVDGDGKVDHLEIEFSLPVMLPSGGSTQFTLSVTGFDPNFDLDTVEFDNTETVVVRLLSRQFVSVAGDTGVVPSYFRYGTRRDVVSFGGVLISDGSFLIPKDGAAPVIVSATAVIDTPTIHVVFSENTTGASAASFEWAALTDATVLSAVYSESDQTSVILTLSRAITEVDAGLGDSESAAIEVTDLNGILDAVNITASSGQFPIVFTPATAPVLDFECTSVNGTHVVITTSSNFDSGFVPHEGAYDIVSVVNGDALALTANITGPSELTLEMDPALLSTTETGGRFSVLVGSTTAFQTTNGAFLNAYPTIRVCPDGHPPAISSITPTTYTDTIVLVKFTEPVQVSGVVFSFTTVAGTARTPALVQWGTAGDTAREVSFAFAPGELPTAEDDGLVVRASNLTDASGNTALTTEAITVEYSTNVAPGVVDTRDGVASNLTQLVIAILAIFVFVMRGVIYAYSKVPTKFSYTAVGDTRGTKDDGTGSVVVSGSTRLAVVLTGVVGYGILATLIYDRGDRKRDGTAETTTSMTLVGAAMVFALMGIVQAEMALVAAMLISSILMHTSRFSDDIGFAALGFLSVALVLWLNSPHLGGRRSLLLALVVAPCAAVVAFAFL